MPRIFVAIPVGEKVRSELSTLAVSSTKDSSAHRQHRQDTRLRWVPEHQYHITLKFLGDIAAAQIQDVGEAVAEAVRGVDVGKAGRMQLHARGLGAFPDIHRVRVVWVGVGEEGGGLRDIHARIEGRLLARGFPPEKRSFTPHITVARSRSNAPLPPSLSAYVQYDFGHWEADRIQVIESRLSPTGPHYVVRDEILLRGAT